MGTAPLIQDTLQQKTEIVWNFRNCFVSLHRRKNKKGEVYGRKKIQK